LERQYHIEKLFDDMLSDVKYIKLATFFKFRK